MPTKKYKRTKAKNLFLLDQIVIESRLACWDKDRLACWDKDRLACWDKDRLACWDKDRIIKSAWLLILTQQDM